MADLVLSLFPGIGLLDRAFEEEGFCIVRGPDVLWGGDIRNFHLPAGKFDGVIGGPPCQCFSALANLVRANGYEPRFGNLIPEYERCVSEAQPTWFLMEEVPAAPVPKVKNYSVHSFLLDNSWLPGSDGYGQEQRRRRRFSFGILDVLGQGAYDLRKHIEMAAFELPEATHAIVGDLRDVPVKIGGSGKLKPQCSAVSQNPVNNSQEAKRRVKHVAVKGDPRPTRREARQKATVTCRAGVPAQTGVVTSSDGGASVRMNRYTLADACRLQGLPEDFLADAPFTAQGKFKAVANGVPLAMGRAIAKAIKAATATREGRGEG